jgi:hypothetical protein
MKFCGDAGRERSEKIQGVVGNDVSEIVETVCRVLKLLFHKTENL